MQAFAQSIARNDEHLFSKWEKLQVLARMAQDEIAAIPEGASVYDEADAVAIAPLERAVELFSAIKPKTAVGWAIKMHVAAWLKDGSLTWFEDGSRADLVLPAGKLNYGVEPVLN